MPHIDVKAGMGITGLLERYPLTAAPLGDLAEALLVAPAALTRAERETIAAFVSFRNRCHFCTESHAAVARALGGTALVDAALSGDLAALPPRLAALLAIADHARSEVAPVPASLIAEARRHGADDAAIHDAGLISAAFCMFNRYVEAFDVGRPQDPAVYAAMGERLATFGYARKRG